MTIKILEVSHNLYPKIFPKMYYNGKRDHKKPVKNDKKMPGMGVESIHQQTEMCQAYYCC